LKLLDFSPIAVLYSFIWIVRHHSHFMRIPPLHYISVAVLIAMSAVGCSKSSPLPIVSFQGYSVGSDGRSRATFEFRNPSQSPITCQFQIQPGDSNGAGNVTIPAGGRSTYTLFVSQTNATSLSVTVMRLVPVHQLTVPIQ
jgi:hypothetical protein